jgi:pimeloyl-ACP methyl ester carboxylesterase
MFRNAEFLSEGATIRGRLYLRSEGRPRGSLSNEDVSRQPVVIMTHGTSATITMVADRYAEVLNKAGFAVLLYDHRNLGISDGEPRGEINPWIQARGYRDAIGYVSSLSEIDASRIAVWGDSFSAGQVLVVGACDERVKAIVSQTTSCGPTMPPADPDGTLFSAVKRTFADGDVSMLDVVIGPMPVVSFDQHGTPSLLTPISAYRWFIEYGGRHGTRWENWVTRFIPRTPAPYHPSICAPHIKVPTLMIIAPQDEMPGANPIVARAAYDTITAKKQLVEIAGGHFGLLHYPSELFDQAARAQIEFLVQNLL